MYVKSYIINQTISLGHIARWGIGTPDYASSCTRVHEAVVITQVPYMITTAHYKYTPLRTFFSAYFNLGDVIAYVDLL